jgi:hypothetical protein
MTKGNHKANYESRDNVKLQYYHDLGVNLPVLDGGTTNYPFSDNSQDITEHNQQVTCKMDDEPIQIFPVIHPKSNNGDAFITTTTGEYSFLTMLMLYNPKIQYKYVILGGYNWEVDYQSTYKVTASKEPYTVDWKGTGNGISLTQLTMESQSLIVRQQPVRHTVVDAHTLTFAKTTAEDVARESFDGITWEKYNDPSED